MMTQTSTFASSVVDPRQYTMSTCLHIRSGDPAIITPQITPRHLCISSQNERLLLPPGLLLGTAPENECHRRQARTQSLLS